MIMMPPFFPTSLQFSLLVMMLLVGSVTAQISCPLGKFCRIGANCPLGKFCRVGANCNSNSSLCVETCPTDTDRFQQGNWCTGNCERIPDGVDYWMDSTLYEIFISPNVAGVFKQLFFIITNKFQLRHVDYDYIDDITFHLYPSDNPYFYFGNGDTTHVAFHDYYDLYLPDTIEACYLSSATSDPIPLDDYELQVTVSTEGTELLRHDIIIHVVSSEPPFPSSPAILVSFNQSTYSVDEDDGPAQPVLVVSNPSSTDITVQVRSSDITATGGVDYDSGPYNVTFPAGVTSVSFDVPINDDNILEINEQFNLTIVLSSVLNGFTVNCPSQAVVTIIDNDRSVVTFSESTYSVDEDDGLAQPVLVLSNPSSTDITVQVRNKDKAATGGGVDYDSGPYNVTFPAGVTSVSFNVPIIDDNIFEGDERFILTIRKSSSPGSVFHGNPGKSTVTILDNDSITVSFSQSTYNVDEDDGPAQPVLVLSNPSSTDITIQVRNKNKTATGGGVDYDSGPYTVTFPAEVISVPFDVPIIDDELKERNESFSLFIRSSIPRNINSVHPNRITVTILDNEAITVSFNQSTYSVNEADGPAQPVLVLSNPSSTDITLRVKSKDINATENVDYGSGPYTVTFRAGVTSVSFDVPIINDNISEYREDFHLSILLSRRLQRKGVSADKPSKIKVVILD